MKGGRSGKIPHYWAVISVSATVASLVAMIVLGIAKAGFLFDQVRISSTADAVTEIRDKSIPSVSEAKSAVEHSSTVSRPKRDIVRPGWIARTYRSPELSPYTLPERDVGAFVLDEIRFDLLAHEGHGIYQPGSAAYRLEGMYAAKLAGQYQFGIDVKYFGYDARKPLETRKCKFKLRIGDKYIVEEIVSLSKSTPKKFVTGAAELRQGLHDAEAIIFCEIGPLQTGADVKICLTVREPGAARFVARRDAFVHYAASEVGPVPITKTN